MQRLARLLVAGCLLLVLVVAALPASALAAPAVQMNAQAASRGIVKQNGWTTVTVELTNLGGDLEGELVLETTEDMSHPQYVVPVSLPAGGKKRIPVSLVAEGGSIAVRLYADGDLVARQEVPIVSLAVSAVLIGVLSGDELGVPALSQLQSGDAMPVQVIRLDAETFPDRIALLEDFNVIALSRFDTATLRPEQLRALEGWVARGGTLLLAGGPEWKRTLSPLPASLLPVAVTDVRDVPLAPLADLGGQELAGSGPVSTADLLWGQGLLYSDGVPLIVSASAGTGRVLYVAFDPGLTPVVNWPGQAALFNRLLGNALQPTTLWRGGNEWSIRSALQQIPDWALPSLWLVGLLLGGYLLLVGPLNYLVLKRMDRREWAWLSVPVIALVSLGVVYFIGFGRFKPLVSHLITVTELSPGSQVATTNAYLGLYAPSLRELSVEVGGNPLVRSFSWLGGVGGNATARVVAGERTRVDLLDMSSYSMSGFEAQQDLVLSGGLELIDARVEGGVVTGRVRNLFDQPVAGIILATANSTVQVGSLEPGQTSEPISLQLSSGTGGRNWFPSYYDVIGRPQADEERRWRILDIIYDEMRNRNETGLLLLGWTEQPLWAPELSDVGKLVTGANLVYAVLPIPVDSEGGGDIPPGIIIGRPSSPSGAEWMPEGYFLQPGRTEFSILLPPMDMTQVESIKLEELRSLYGTVPPRFFVKNQQSGEWIPVTGPAHTLTDWQSFVSPSGLIELAYEAQEHAQVPAPTVSVKGVSR